MTATDGGSNAQNSFSYFYQVFWLSDVLFFKLVFRRCTESAHSMNLNKQIFNNILINSVVYDKFIGIKIIAQIRIYF